MIINMQQAAMVSPVMTDRPIIYLSDCTAHATLGTDVLVPGPTPDPDLHSRRGAPLSSSYNYANKETCRKNWSRQLCSVDRFICSRRTHIDVIDLRTFDLTLGSWDFTRTLG